MEKFLALSDEKQTLIRNAALSCFSQHGYEKASINDIAKMAGISKASLFQYFGTKQNLYEYLVEHSSTQMKAAYQEQALYANADFFDRVQQAIIMKIDNLKKNPYIAAFIISVAKEPSIEISEHIKDLMQEGEKHLHDLMLRDADLVKFKHPEDAPLLFRTLMHIGYGIVDEIEGVSDFDRIVCEMENILKMLKYFIMKQAVIMLDGLTKSYGKHRGIENLTYSVLPGEIFGFIGPNGAGKTTTIRTLMGLLKPTSGNATIFGLDCTQHAAEIAKNVGYLPSENCYYNNLKVKEQLQYTADLYGVNCHDRIEELAERLNLDLSRKIGDLSLGNKKKVGIVSALLPSPKLLILDEPTSGLDPLVQQTFYEILREENSRGTTILFSSHVLSEVQKLCDRVCILREGRLIAIQSMKELRENGYKKISLSTEEPVPAQFFDIPGIANLEQNQNSISFMFNGNVMTIMEKLHKLPLVDILIEEPSLEEIFLHYYE